ncbi:ABC transporter ATP-binding protein [Halosegnis marinus]|uniref:Probable branched-chain amino acid transport ATP-binding protein LivG n=1 Tax=Halosegnis marinus TaxID=3034023 RepID=A0ABD5ZRB0_9EURY|nr:ABC transporter ATP-binding protein [Halosegnis sp. DT85]
MAILETHGLTKRFGGLTAVDDVDLTVDAGETRAIIGPNGAGKSTFINLVTGLLQPTEGSVTFDGTDITGQEPHEIVQRGVSKSFQTASIFPEMTVRENVQMAAMAAERGSFRFDFLKRRDSFTGVYDTTEEMLRAVELWGDRDTNAASLPYGDKRRLEIGIALASEPDLLFMDEPTAGMSPEETDATVDLVERLQDELGLTIVLVEHDMEIIFRIADRIAVLNRGSVIADATPDEVQGDPDVQEAYLGGVEL